MTVPTRKQFIDDALAVSSSQQVGAIGQFMNEAAEINPEASPQEIQVAAGMRALPGILKRSMGRSTRDVISNARQTVSPIVDESADAMGTLDAYRVRQTKPGFVEADRLMKGLQTDEDLGKLLEVMGTSHKAGVRPWNEVRAASENAAKIESDIIKLMTGQNKGGLLTDKQMFGARRMLVNMGQSTQRLADRIIAGDTSLQTLTEYKISYQRMAAVYQTVRNNASETARALNQQKMLATALDADNLKDLAIMNMQDGGPDAIIAHAQLFGNTASSDGIGAALDHMANKANSGMKVMVNYWKNNILSSPTTHMVNFASSLATQTYESGVRMVAGAIGETRGAITGATNRAYMADQIAGNVSAMTSTIDAIKMMGHTLKTNESMFLQFKDETESLLEGSAANRAKELAMTASFRLLRAQDESFKAVSFNREAYSLATRDGIMKGLEGPELVAHVDDVMRKLPKEIYDAAMEEADKLTFTRAELGGAVGTLATMGRSLMGKYPAFSFVMPFVTTPANLLRYTMELTPLAPLGKDIREGIAKGGAARDYALAKIASAYSMSAVVYGLYEAGIVTGSGPTDYRQRRNLEQATGWRSQGVKIGDTWYSLEKTDPFGSAIALMLDGFEQARYAKNEKDAAAGMAAAANAIANNVFDSSWVAGFVDFVNVATGEKSIHSVASNIAGGMVPYSSALAAAADTVNTPMAPKATGQDLIPYLKQKIQNRTPFDIGVRYVRPARYWDGEIVQPGPGEIGSKMLGVRSGIGVDRTAVDTEFVANGITPQDPDPVVSIGPVNLDLLSLDRDEGIIYDSYIQHMGKARKEILNKVIDHRQYKALSDKPGGRGPKGLQAALLERGMEAARRVGTATFLEELIDIGSSIPEVSDIMSDMIGAGDPLTYIKRAAETLRETGNVDREMVLRGSAVRGPISPPGEPVDLREQLGF